MKDRNAPRIRCAVKHRCMKKKGTKVWQGGTGACRKSEHRHAGVTGEQRHEG